ncbi:MAG: hypothetical protein WBA97_34405 [Actinophytocola sp.]|uniref:hypothetical protein n=1 Tax=Actinophytocola sp. TaxID=1872138 RepID=UPI003C7871A2
MTEDRERHARFLCRMWDDGDWIALSPRGQWFYMLLTSQAALNRAGITALTSKRWKRLASGPSVEQQIALAMKELEDENFVVVDHDTEEVLVRSYMRNDGIAKQPNVLKMACRQAREVLSPKLRAALEVELRRLDPPPGESVAAKSAAAVLAATIDALAKGSRNPSPNPSGKASVNGSANPGGRGRGSSTSHLGNSNGSTASTSEIASRPSDPPRPDVESLCSRLLAAIQGNGAKGSITKKWRTEARLLLDRDGRSLDEASRLIDWATSDSFWKSNILSMPTFRAKYDQLRLQASRRDAPPVPNATDQRVAALLAPVQNLPNLRALPGGA